MPLIICGIATVSTVLVAAAVAYPQCTAHIATVSLILGAVALCLATNRDTTAVSPIGRRSVELLEYLAIRRCCAAGCLALRAVWRYT